MRAACFGLRDHPLGNLIFNFSRFQPPSHGRERGRKRNGKCVLTARPRRSPVRGSNCPKVSTCRDSPRCIPITAGSGRVWPWKASVIGRIALWFHHPVSFPRSMNRDTVHASGLHVRRVVGRSPHVRIVRSLVLVIGKEFCNTGTYVQALRLA